MKKRNTEGSGRTNRDRPTRAIKASAPKSRAPKRKTEGRGADDERPARRNPSASERPARPRPAEDRNTDRRDFSERPARRPDGERPPRENTGRSFDKPFRSERSDGDRPGRTARPQRNEEGNDTRRSPEDRPPRKSYGDKPFARERDQNFERPARSSDRPRRDDERSGDRPPRKTYGERSFDRDRDRPFDKPTRSSDRPRRDDERSGDRPPRKTFGEKSFDRDKDRPFDKPTRSTDRPRRDDERSEDRPARKSYGDKPAFSKPRSGGYERRPSKYGGKFGSKRKESNDDGTLRLNRFLSNAGIASRREADSLITAGLVTVNGKVVTELGTKVFPTDDVRFEGQRIKAEKKVYILLNKPTKYITTTDDPRERDTVMQLIAGACRERVYPVGRLDRNTTGLLLFTNDGDMAKKLTHPSHGAKKLYHVTLNKKLSAADMKKIREGVMLEEGKAMVDNISFVEGATTHEVGIELHIGWNRVVRRIFEELEYEVIKLDRVMFAGLSKKKLPRGHYRFLTEKEVSILKML